MLREQGERLLAGDALGRSQALERLFRFLLKCSIEGRSPKELEIADEVFGRTAASVDQDASVRVHIHRLRRKLDEFYSRAGADDGPRLVLPKGAYKLAIETAPVDATRQIMSVARPSLRQRLSGIAAVVAMLVVAIAATWWIADRRRGDDPVLTELQSSTVWKPLLSGSRRVTVVVGDYYIMGERRADGEVSRLVREFDINGPKDLERVAVDDPERAKTYVDLGLNYFPVGVGNALRAVVPVLRRTDPGIVATVVMPVSQLSPVMVKYSNLVYLGYLSGLGSLRDPMFSGSRFAIGSSYDEVIDRQTGRRYMADTHLDLNATNPSQDYALISKFRSVTGNWVLIIAGTRDAALMEAADYATHLDTIAEMTRSLNGAESFDALLAVESLHNVGLRARLIGVSARRTEADWSGKRSQQFPDDLSVSEPADDRAR